MGSIQSKKYLNVDFTFDEWKFANKIQHIISNIYKENKQCSYSKKIDTLYDLIMLLSKDNNAKQTMSFKAKFYKYDYYWMIETYTSNHSYHDDNIYFVNNRKYSNNNYDSLIRYLLWDIICINFKHLPEKKERIEYNCGEWNFTESIILTLNIPIVKYIPTIISCLQFYDNEQISIDYNKGLSLINEEKRITKLLKTKLSFKDRDKYHSKLEKLNIDITTATTKFIKNYSIFPKETSNTYNEIDKIITKVNHCKKLLVSNVCKYIIFKLLDKINSDLWRDCDCEK